MLGEDVNEYIEKAGYEIFTNADEVRKRDGHPIIYEEDLKIGALLMIASSLNEILRYLKENR